MAGPAARKPSAGLLRKTRTKAPHVRRALLAWYGRNARDLPWRRTRDPYRIYLSEVLLQQTRVDTVLAYYRRFLRELPTVTALASAEIDFVLKLWEGLGYYRRAHHLHESARVIVRQWAGRLPTTAAELQKLPGVGRYTAAAVASIAFHEPVAVVDGNVQRVLTRLLAVRQPVDSASTRAALWSAAETLLSPRRPGRFNQAMMELGARICTPRAPRCAACPVRRHCDGLAGGLQDRLPVARKRKATPHYVVVAAAVYKRGRVLLGRRPPGAMLGGLWEFPGGKVQPGETHARALARELQEEVGIGVEIGERIAAVNHAYSHFRITLHVYRCSHTSGQPHAKYHTQLKWVLPSQFDRYAFPAANKKVFPSLVP